MNARRLIIGVAVAALALPACGGDDDGGSGDGGIEVDGAWARTSPAMATAGAAYMTITAEEADELVGVSVPAEVAATAEIHETVAVESTDTTMAGGMGSDTTMAGGMGEMTMRPVESLALPAGTPVELKPGGYHIMMLDLAEPLEVGAEIELTLEFANAGPQTVSVPVREDAP
jgi:copper(I)-binding protein